MSDVFIDGDGQLSHAGKHTATQSLGGQIAEEALHHVSHDAEVGVKCMLNRGCFTNHS